MFRSDIMVNPKFRIYDVPKCNHFDMCRIHSIHLFIQNLPWQKKKKKKVSLFQIYVYKLCMIVCTGIAP